MVVGERYLEKDRVPPQERAFSLLSEKKQRNTVPINQKTRMIQIYKYP